MIASEALALARYAKAARPQQKWDEYTPDVWADALDDVRYADAKTAVVALTKAAAFIDVPAIRAEVKRLRRDRLDRNPLPAFPGDPDDVAAELAWKREWIARIGDGEAPPEPAALPAREMPALGALLRRPPRTAPTTAPVTAPQGRPRLREPESVLLAQTPQKDPA